MWFHNPGERPQRWSSEGKNAGGITDEGGRNGLWRCQRGRSYRSFLNNACALKQKALPKTWRGVIWRAEFSMEMGLYPFL